MPSTEYHQNSFLNRISIRRNQFNSIDNSDVAESEELEHFNKHVAERFSALLSAAAPDSPNSSPEPPILSIYWFRNLLDVFLCCETEFKVILIQGRDPIQFSRPPLDRLLPDLLERSVKALDVCNAVTQGLDLIHHWQKLAQISVTALEQEQIGEGQVRRAKKALTTLLTSMVFDDKENANSNYHGKWAERTKSLSRRGSGHGKDRPAGNFRALSWSVAKSWSAAKQIQTMSGNLVAPRGGEATGIAMPVYVMNTVMVMVMWALVAAVPCQERNGLSTHFQLPRNLGWTQPIIGLQEKIVEEWKKKEKRGSPGLLEELQRMERVARGLIEFADSFVFPLEEEKVGEVAAQVAELADVCQKMEEGVGPLQQLVREVFHRIVKSRAEILDVLDQVSKLVAPVQY